MKGHCDYHASPPVEAERDGKYIVLRCADCGRIRGLRLPRKQVKP